MWLIADGNNVTSEKYGKKKKENKKENNKKKKKKEEKKQRDDNEDILRAILVVRVAFKIDHLENDW